MGTRRSSGLFEDVRAVGSGVARGLVAEGPGFSVVLDPSFSPDLALQKVQSSLKLQKDCNLGELCAVLGATWYYRRNHCPDERVRMDQTTPKGLKGGFSYLKQAMADVTRTPRWFVILLLLALVTCIPVFGAVVMYGFLLRWAREAAWRIDTPMRPRVFDNSDGVLYAFGWRAFGLALLYSLIPGVVAAALMSGQVAEQIASGALAGSAFGGSAAAAVDVTLDLPGQIISLAVEWLVMPVIWVAMMRMALYRDGGAGLQVGKIFQMIRRDAGGLVPAWLFYCVFNTALSFAASAISNWTYTALLNPSAAMLGMSLAMLVATFALQVASTFLMMVTLRAVGRWTAQFEVAQWGPKDAPLPPSGGYGAAQ